MMHPREQLDPRSLSGSTDEEVLRNFVGSVMEWRGRSTTGPGFRRDDLIVLAGLLGTDADGIERRLIALTGCNRVTARRFRRALLLGLAALPLAPFAVPSTPRPEAAAAAAAAAAAPRSPAVEVARVQADAGVADHPATAPTSAPPPVDGTGASDARSVAPPEAPVGFDAAQASAAPAVVVPVAAPAAVAPTAPAVLVPGSEAIVSIPSVGIELPVFAGGQDVIDQGRATHYWAPGWHDPAAAGGVGTYWLAAHHSTHGSPFLRLPDVAVDDQIVITTASRTFTYTVTALAVVEEDAGFDAVYGTDPGGSRILLQTCLDHVRRLLVYGTLTATT